MTDRSGFDEFVHARGPALARTAYLLTGDHHLAEDLVQAALVQAAKHWERIETSPEACVRRTMYHQNISWWRRRRLAETPLESYDAPMAASDPTIRLTLELADTQTFTADPSAWDRGRRARRSSRMARGAAALAVVALVVGIGTPTSGPTSRRTTPSAARRSRSPATASC